MARQEADRDDLFAELRSAVCRWELQVPGRDCPVVAGIRPAGRLSIYFHPDCVYHYDGGGRLQRAYVSGFLYRTQGGTLARLMRERSEQETRLVRHDLSPEELRAFLAEMQAALERLQEGLLPGAVGILRSDGADARSLHALQQRVRECLDALPRLAPPFPGRKH